MAELASTDTLADHCHRRTLVDSLAGDTRSQTLGHAGRPESPAPACALGNGSPARKLLLIEPVPAQKIPQLSTDVRSQLTTRKPNWCAVLLLLRWRLGSGGATAATLQHRTGWWLPVAHLAWSLLCRQCGAHDGLAGVCPACQPWSRDNRTARGGSVVST